MKKLALHILLLFAFVSCQEEVKFNNPSFQGLKNTIFWRAIDSKATLSNNVLTIEAYTRNEKVTLKTNSTLLKTYILGDSNSITATYALTNADGTITFSTGNGFGDGQIEITEYDAVNKTVTGTFRFNADNLDNNPLFGPTLNFQQGVFYKVPIN